MAAVYAVGPHSAQARVTVVKKGKVRAVVVTADKPSLTAAYAAKELVLSVGGGGDVFEPKVAGCFLGWT